MSFLRLPFSIDIVSQTHDVYRLSDSDQKYHLAKALTHGSTRVHMTPPTDSGMPEMTQVEAMLSRDVPGLDGIQGYETLSLEHENGGLRMRAECERTELGIKIKIVHDLPFEFVLGSTSERALAGEPFIARLVSSAIPTFFERVFASVKDVCGVNTLTEALRSQFTQALGDVITVEPMTMSGKFLVDEIDSFFSTILIFGYVGQNRRIEVHYAPYMTTVKTALVATVSFDALMDCARVTNEDEAVKSKPSDQSVDVPTVVESTQVATVLVTDPSEPAVSVEVVAPSATLPTVFVTPKGTFLGSLDGPRIDLGGSYEEDEHMGDETKQDAVVVSDVSVVVVESKRSADEADLDASDSLSKRVSLGV